MPSASVAVDRSFPVPRCTPRLVAVSRMSHMFSCEAMSAYALFTDRFVASSTVIPPLAPSESPALRGLYPADA